MLRDSNKPAFLVIVSMILVIVASELIIGSRGESISCQDQRYDFEEEQLGIEFRRFLRWRRSTRAKNQEKFVAPPPIDEPARMGRYIVNQADWTAVATISTRKDILHFPMANIKSISDGPLGNGTGVPYMYLSPFDFTAQDLTMDNRVSLVMTLAEGSYCRDQDMDPMDPRCARIILSGTIVQVDNSSPEYQVAKSSVFGRHPWLAHMPKDHHFFFAKLEIISIAVIDTFGGAKYVTVEDYMNPPPPKNLQRFVYRV